MRTRRYRGGRRCSGGNGGERWEDRDTLLSQQKITALIAVGGTLLMMISPQSSFGLRAGKGCSFMASYRSSFYAALLYLYRSPDEKRNAYPAGEFVWARARYPSETFRRPRSGRVCIYFQYSFGLSDRRKNSGRTLREGTDPKTGCEGHSDFLFDFRPAVYPGRCGQRYAAVGGSRVYHARSSLCRFASDRAVSDTAFSSSPGNVGGDGRRDPFGCLRRGIFSFLRQHCRCDGEKKNGKKIGAGASVGVHRLFFSVSDRHRRIYRSVYDSYRCRQKSVCADFRTEWICGRSFDRLPRNDSRMQQESPDPAVPFAWKIAACTFLSSFGGLSIAAQSMSVLRNSGMEPCIFPAV